MVIIFKVLDFAGQLLQQRRDKGELGEQFETDLKKLVRIAFERERDIKQSKLGHDRLPFWTKLTSKLFLSTVLIHLQIVTQQQSSERLKLRFHFIFCLFRLFRILFFACFFRALKL